MKYFFFFLVPGLLFAADSYQQVVVFGMDSAKCESFLNQKPKIDRHAQIVLFECSPSDGFLRITVGGKSPSSSMSLIKAKILAVLGKPVDQELVVQGGTRITTTGDIYADLFRQYVQTPTDELLKNLLVFCEKNPTDFLKECGDLQMQTQTPTASPTKAPGGGGK